MSRLHENYGLETEDDVTQFMQDIAKDVRILLKDVIDGTREYTPDENGWFETSLGKMGYSTIYQVETNFKENEDIEIGTIFFNLNTMIMGKIDKRKIKYDNQVISDDVMEFFVECNNDGFMKTIENDFNNKIRLELNNDFVVQPINDFNFITKLEYKIILLDF